MTLEIKIGSRIAKVESLSCAGNKVILAIDDKKIEVDIVMVEEGVYSLIYDGASYNVELTREFASKKYTVNTLFKTFNLEIIDSESRYLKNREKADLDEDETIISTSMPGKVVKVLVKSGDKVTQDTSVIIIEAMKMQNHYKVKKDRLIKEVYVKEGDTIIAHQPLILVE